MFDVTANTKLVVLSNGVLANDGDPEGVNLVVGIESGPSSGTLVMQPDGLFEYIPNSGFVGTDSFTYSASDGQQASVTTTVTIGVAPPVSNGAGNNDAGNSALASTPAVIATSQTSPAPTIPAARPVVVPLIDLKALNADERENQRSDETSTGGGEGSDGGATETEGKLWRTKEKRASQRDRLIQSRKCN